MPPELLQILSLSAKLVDRYTVPIYRFYRNTLELDRTGVLLKVANHHFVLTAAHHIEEYCSNAVYLCMAFSREHLLPIPLVEAVFHTTEYEGGQVVRDVAAIHISAVDAEEIPQQWKFLTLANVDQCAEPIDGLYLAFGYPTAWFTLDNWSAPPPLPFVGKATVPTSSKMYDPSVHLAISIDQNAARLPIDNEPIEKSRLPRLQGMSGCGIW